MPLPYGQVKDLYDELQKAGVVTQSLPEWSGQMNDLTGTDTYSPVLPVEQKERLSALATKAKPQVVALLVA